MKTTEFCSSVNVGYNNRTEATKKSPVLASEETPKNHIADKRRSKLALLTLEKEIVQGLDLETVVENFSSERENRVTGLRVKSY